MANKIVLKKSSVAAKVPLTMDLDYGELALNYADEKLYFKNSSNVIKSFNVNATGATLTIGTGLSGGSYNGSTAVTIAIDSTVATLSGTQTLTNKTINLTNNTLTATSAQIAAAVTDETGSGSLVFATSPTLVTPNIGAATGTSLTTTGGSVLARAAATQDGIEIRGRAGGTSNWEVILTPATLSADRTITFPNVSGTVITTGDTGTVTSTMIADGTIVNADINASAAIAVSKLAASTISGVTLGNNLNTLTLNVSGTGLSGSTTYNGSAAATFTVTSNATSANTASAIVARDASGNFTAGTITAALSGNASTATTLQTARTINTVSFNGSANIVVEPFVESDDSTNATRYITFVDSSTDGHQRLNEDSNFTINPSTGTVTTNGAFASIFSLNKNTIDTSYSIPSGYNATSAGPVVINNGITITIPDGSTWVIV